MKFHIQKLENPIQNYPWGSKTYLAQLRGIQESPQPEAELWMGAHPKSPSRIQGYPLSDLIKRSPEKILGPSVVQKFHGELPFLFKLLAAAQPLSIQAHPNLTQAQEGFVRENQQGIPLDSPHRNYRDPNHKPEIICALTPFWGLNGFRPIDEILTLLAPLSHPVIQQIRQYLTSSSSLPIGLHDTMEYLWQLSQSEQQELAIYLLQLAQSQSIKNPEAYWIQKVYHFYPGDIGIICILLLNLVLLQPGEAMFCEAGVLHAYLEGFGVELMANSDNVLRGGLTSKHIDVPELMKILRFESCKVPILTPDSQGYYPSSVPEFRLKRIQVHQNSVTYNHHQAVAILVCTEGKVQLTDTGCTISLTPSESVFVPGVCEPITIQGEGTLYAAEVNHSC